MRLKHLYIISSINSAFAAQLNKIIIFQILTVKCDICVEDDVKFLVQTTLDKFTQIDVLVRNVIPRFCSLSSSLAKVPIRFPPLPLGGFRQVFKLSANMRLTSFASNI